MSNPTVPSTADSESRSSLPTARCGRTAHDPLRRLVEAPTPRRPIDAERPQSPTRRSGRITRVAGPTAWLGPRLCAARPDHGRRGDSRSRRASATTSASTRRPLRARAVRPPRPRAHPGVYRRVLRAASVGWARPTRDGWWDVDDLTGFLRLLGREVRRADPARSGVPAV